MKLIDTLRQDAEPPIYTFVFDDRNDQGAYAMLRMPDSPQWPYSPFLYGEYHRYQENQHLGERVLFHELGSLVMDRFFQRLGY